MCALKSRPGKSTTCRDHQEHGSFNVLAARTTAKTWHQADVAKLREVLESKSSNPAASLRRGRRHYHPACPSPVAHGCGADRWLRAPGCACCRPRCSCTQPRLPPAAAAQSPPGGRDPAQAQSPGNKQENAIVFVPATVGPGRKKGGDPSLQYGLKIFWWSGIHKLQSESVTYPTNTLIHRLRKQLPVLLQGSLC